MDKRLINPIIMWSIIVIGMIVINYILPANLYLFRINSLRYLLIPVVIYWIYFFFNAFIIHRQAIKSVAKINKIIDKGVYGIVRHPIYSSDIVLGVGIFFFRPTLIIAINIVWMSLFLIYWMKKEENALIERFGKDYEEYKKKVPMIIPKIRK